MNKFDLDKHTKITTGFKVPEDYFEQLPNTILNKIKSEKARKTKVIKLKNIAFASAAVFILLFSISFLIKNSNATLEEIETPILENYIAYQTSISTYDLYNLLDAEDINAIQIDLNFEDQSVEDLLTTNPNFENYLID